MRSSAVAKAGRRATIDCQSFDLADPCRQRRRRRKGVLLGPARAAGVVGRAANNGKAV
jgi:hypothetical protein